MLAERALKKHREAIEKTYTDRATISRYVEEEKPSGETSVSEKLFSVYKNQPCRISQKAIGTNGQTETTNNILYENKLFIAPETIIKQGDEIKVTRGRMTAAGWVPLGTARTYTAGEPFFYLTHQEISLQRDDKA